MKVWYRKVRSYWALYRDANGMRRDAATAAIAHLRQIKWHGWLKRSTYDQTLANKADAQFAITALKSKRSCWRRWPNRRWPRVTAMAIDATFGADGLNLDGSIAQYEFVWRIFRENVLRPGRIAAIL